MASRIVMALLLLVSALAQGQDLTVSAAISLKEAMTEIAGGFKQETGKEVRLNFGASGELMNQIKGGAPVDVFVSAAVQQVDELEKAKLTVAGSRCVVVENRLVLIAPPGTTLGNWQDLAAAKRVAVGEPKTVPAGQYAMQLLAKKNLLAALKGKLIYGTNVRQVLAYVQAGEVDAGLVYLTDAYAAGQTVKQVIVAEADAHDAISYPAVVIAGKRETLAGQFVKYLLGEKAQGVLVRRGFAAPRPATTRPSHG